LQNYALKSRGLKVVIFPANSYLKNKQTPKEETPNRAAKNGQS
jgi:glutathione peroxidase-family protein